MHYSCTRKILFILVVCLAAPALLCVGCEKKPSEPPELFFVREGVAIPAANLESLTISGDDGKSASYKKGQPQAIVTQQGDILIPFDWRAGASYSIQAKIGGDKFDFTQDAPLKPSPLAIVKIPMEKMHDYQGHGANPDTEVCFSPDEKYVAIGSFFGYLRVVEIPTGKTVLEKRLAEGMVKRICWRKKENGWTLYVGEQSPDSFIYAMDAFTGEIQWKYRLADDIGTSSPDSGDSRMRVYNFPGPYYMHALPGGDLIVIGLHGRYRGEDFVYDTLVYSLDGDTGTPVWKWPDDRNLPYSVTWAGASTDGSTLALLTDTWLGVQNPHPKFKNGALICLDGKRGKARWQYVVPPLEPYYDRASGWQGMAVSQDGAYVALGLNDGRGMLFDAKAMEDSQSPQEPLWVRNVGTPVMNGNIPVASSIAYTELAGDAVFFGLPGTTIPPNAASSSSKNKPAPHPRSHSVCAYSLSGDPLWEWQCQASVQGIYPSPDGRWVGVGITDDRGAADPEDFGMALFDMRLADGGQDPLVYRYYTQGCVFFMGDASATGRYMAITEYPYSPDDGKTLHGEYRVHVVH